jgi:hypothetical protein
MTRSRRRAVWWLVLLFALVALVLLAPIQRSIGDGGFPSAEYRLTFVDTSGRPVPEVGLRVEMANGGVSYLYPVDEFVPDHVPTSDADGRMVFHHTSGGLEFSTHERGNLLGMWFGSEGSPKYVLVFSVRGREVHRVQYHELLQWSDLDGSARVKQAWKATGWPTREYAAHQADWSAYRNRLFDADGDGQLDREERVARGYFERVMLESDPVPGTRDIEYYVIERRIDITVP